MNKVQNRPAPVSQRPRTADRLRRGTSTARRVLRGLLAPVPPARPVAAPAPVATQPVPDPADLFAADEIPPLADIEAAAFEYDRASDQARRADRSKRAAKKILDKVPSGIHGCWKVSRTESSRQTPDLAAITATYKALGLGPVPMKPCAASIKVEIVTDLAELVEVAA